MLTWKLKSSTRTLDQKWSTSSIKRKPSSYVRSNTCLVQLSPVPDASIFYSCKLTVFFASCLIMSKIYPAFPSVRHKKLQISNNCVV
ncbi:hypothetical protein M5D96_001648 [Drosophila gunungcola]|uniref:Uncharacterized protein n=1 Tax=Drosophila gunungcola TaxID=103775 RepID=A0A9Q0BUS4_9MUSC|nr:hypothetical protein M5D96_001648 [Drosophila gunungcola]